MTWIAERHLIARERETGAQRPITLRIGMPEDDDGAACCAVEITGLLDSIKPVMGIDRLQALHEAGKFLDNYLLAKRADLDIFWPTGEPYVPLP